MKLGCTESWLEEMVRQRKIPFTRLSGAIHFTDAHIQEIIRVFEVRPRQATSTRAARAPVFPQPVPGREPVQLVAREPRKQRGGSARTHEPGE